MKLPKPNVTYAIAGSKDLGEKEIKGILCNPIYAGVPPYPSIISDEEWISSAKKLIQEDGVEQFLVNMMYVLRKSMQLAQDAQE
jgi:hypothetical protein